MKLELKNIKHSPSLSDDSEAFTCDIYIDGELVADARDDGNGGEVRIDAKYGRKGSEADKLAYMRDNRMILDVYDKWAKSQPNHGIGKYPHFPEGLERSLVFDVGDQFEAWLTAKEDEKRFKRLCKTNWLFYLHRDPDNGKPLQDNVFFKRKKYSKMSDADFLAEAHTKYQDNFKEFINARYA